MKRSCSGKFLAKCRNIHHVDWASSDDSPLTRFRTAPLSKKTHIEIKELSGKLRKGREAYVCTDCLSYSENLQGLLPSPTSASQTQAPPSQTDAEAPGATTSSSGSVTVSAAGPTTADVQDLINRVLSLPQENIAEVAHAIGKSQRKPILTDITSSKLTFLPSSDSLLAHDSVEWLRSRNTVLSSFVCGLSDCDLNSLQKREKGSEKKAYGVCKAVEQSYFNINPKCVLPHSFKENILIYSVSKSKLLPDALGGVSPTGTYYRLRKWLDHQACQELPSLNGDVVIAFDNDQVVGKTYHVKADNKVRVSVVTSICAFEEDGKLQERKELKPSNWQGKRQEQFEAIVDAKSEVNVRASELHYKEMYKSLFDAISEVVSEQRHNSDGKLIDDIDLHVSQNAFDREYRLCPSCSESNRRSKRICAYCGERLRTRVDTEGDEDSSSCSDVRAMGLEDQSGPSVKRVTFGTETQEEEERKAAHISARDPFFVNPNSVGTIAAVFRHIGKDANVQDVAENGDLSVPAREWICVVCDGLPYSIALTMLSSFYECKKCKEKVQGQDQFEQHMTRIHPGVQYEIKDNLEFGWLLLHAGHGHYEMNAVRSFVSLNWDVFMSDAAKVMGFRSERAQKYAKSTSDHHKAWELLQIVYHGGLRELLLPYVRQCLAEGSSPTPEGYLRWSKAVQDKSYAYFQEQILTYTQAIINLRKGLRTNNADLVMAGRIKHAPIFHGRNHPKYQAIEVMELATFLSAPPPVQEFLARHASYSASGDPTKGEDLDFVLENLNKQSKDWIPRGVPTEHEWLRIFRNLDKLNEIRQKTLHSMGQSTSTTPRSTSHDPSANDIKAWRVFIRESGYLSSPMTSGPISAISGEELDSSLIHLSSIGTNRRRHFTSRLLAAGDIPKPDPVLVTKSERADFEDITKQTKERICQRIKALINSLADDVSRDILMKELSHLKSHRKEELIGLFYKVKDRSDESDSDVSDD